MSTLARHWPTIRQIAYGIGAAVLGASALAGWITADQAEAWTGQLSQALGAVALIVAGLYVDRSAGAPTVQPTVKVPDLGDDLADVIADARRRLLGGGHG